MDGICVIDDPSPAFVQRELVAIFGKRLTGFSMEDTTAFFNVDTRHYQMVTGAEVLRIGIRLNIDPQRITLEDHPPNSIRFVVDCAAVTKPEIPSAIAKERP